MAAGEISFFRFFPLAWGRRRGAAARQKIEANISTSDFLPRHNYGRTGLLPGPSRAIATSMGVLRPAHVSFSTPYARGVTLRCVVGS